MNTTLKYYRKNRRRARKGATLIDVAVGSMLMASLLIPSLHLMGESQQNTQRLAIRQTLLHTAEQQIEALKVRLSEPAAFTNTLARPIFETRNITTTMGIPSRVEIRAVSDPTVGAAELLTLSAIAWHDKDRNGAVDSGEPVIRLRTQWMAPR